MTTIRVVLTMDCEPTTATSHPAATGPSDWTAGEDAVRGYFDMAAEFGWPVTFFVHPEAATAQPTLFRELEGRGACLGLHMHPWKYSLWRHKGKRFFAHYGGLSRDEQSELIEEAALLWAEAIGHRPGYFRPGTFSANDAIFAVLTQHGFRGGSCTAPRPRDPRDAGHLDGWSTRSPSGRRRFPTSERRVGLRQHASFRRFLPPSRRSSRTQHVRRLPTGCGLAGPI